MKHSYRLLACVACSLFLLACGDRAEPGVTDGWLGQWNGPEGTFLRLEGSSGQYSVTIQDLDGPRTYAASAAGDHIEFERNGDERRPYVQRMALKPA